MGFLLGLTDPARHEMRRLTLELSGLCRSASVSGKDLKSRFMRFAQTAAGARRLAQAADTGRFEYLAALETAGVRLQKTILGMDLHGLEPDAAIREALLLTGNALDHMAAFISGPDDRTLPLKATRLAASASRALRSAGKGAQTDPRDFVLNLKFCTIYSDLGRAVDAVEDCAGLLVGMA